MHKDWCGKTCSECEHPCELDQSMPCSPDCECLGSDGEHNCSECQQCDAMHLYRVPISYDGSVCVRAMSAEEARNLVCDMTVDKMYQASGGSWSIDDAEKAED